MKARSLGFAAVALTLAAARPAAAQEACARETGPVRLVVEVGGLRDARGQVAVTVYPDNPRRFLAPKGKLARKRVAARLPVSAVCFGLPQAGHYAVAVYHDSDGDRDFDRNAVGMPREGFGFSNDAPTRMSLPSFESVRFRTRPGENTIRIRMRYR